MQFLLVDKDLLFDENLTGNEYRIYSCLLFLYNKEKQCSYPSIEVIADRLNISISTVKRTIKKLADLGYIVIEKRKGLAGNFNVYKKLKHLITNAGAKKKAPKVGIDSNGEMPIDGQITVEEALQEIEEAPVTKQDIIDNHNNVRMARAVTNIDNSNFAKKILSLAEEELVREAIKDFKAKRGKTPTFLIKLLVDQYYKNKINLSGALLNLLRKDYLVI